MIYLIIYHCVLFILIIALDKILYSKASNEVFYFSIFNDQSFDVELYWIDFEGIIKPHQTIKSGRTIMQHSYFNHVWVVFNIAHDVCLGFELGVDNKFQKVNSLLLNDSTEALLAL